MDCKGKIRELTGEAKKERCSCHKLDKVSGKYSFFLEE